MRLFIVRWIGGWETNATAMVSHPPEPPVILWFFGFLRFSSDFTVVSTGQCRCRCSDALRRWRRRAAIGQTARDTSARPSCIASARLSRRLRVRGARGYASLAEAIWCDIDSAPARLWRAPGRLRRRASQLRRAVSRARSRATRGRRAPEIILGHQSRERAPLRAPRRAPKIILGHRSRERAPASKGSPPLFCRERSKAAAAGRPSMRMGGQGEGVQG